MEVRSGQSERVVGGNSVRATYHSVVAGGHNLGLQQSHWHPLWLRQALPIWLHSSHRGPEGLRGWLGGCLVGNRALVSKKGGFSGLERAFAP